MIKKLTVKVFQSDAGFTAICEEFGVTGSGDTEQEALNCLVFALRSTFTASAASLKEDPSNLENFAEVEMAF
jgi:hypothetical protein